MKRCFGKEDWKSVCFRGRMKTEGNTDDSREWQKKEKKVDVLNCY